MCLGGGGGNTPAQEVTRDPFEDESAGGITKGQGAPREVSKDTRGSQENKDKLKFQAAREWKGASPDKPKLSAPRERSKNTRGYLNPSTDILQGKDIGF